MTKNHIPRTITSAGPALLVVPKLLYCLLLTSKLGIEKWEPGQSESPK